MARLETISTEGGVMIATKYGFTSTDPEAFVTIRGAQWDFASDPSLLNDPGFVPVDAPPPLDVQPPSTDPVPSDPGGLTTPDMAAGSPDNATIATDVSQLPPTWQSMFASAEQAGQSPAEALQTVQAAQQFQSAEQAANQDIVSTFSGWQRQPLVNTADNSIWTRNPDGSPGAMIGQFQNGVFTPSNVAMPNGGFGIPQFDSNGNIVGYYSPSSDGTQANMYGANGAFTGTTDAATATKGSWLDSVNSAIKPLSSLLATPAGKLLAGLGASALGTGLGALIASNQKRVSITPNAGTVQQLLGVGQGAALTGLLNGGAAGLSRSVSSGLQGQGTLADLLKLQSEQSLGQQTIEQPLEENVGLNAVAQLPGQMNATTNPNITGTATLGQKENTLAQGQVDTQGKIMTGIGGQIQKVLNGGYSNPILENQIKLARDAFNAKMYAQLGSGWETSTPGMQAKEQQDLLESSQRHQDQQSTLANYTPLYSGMLQAATGNQQQATGQVQQAQGQGVSQNAALSQMGKTPSNTLAQGLTSVAPAPTYAGLQSAGYTQAQLVNAQQADNMANVANANNTTNTLAKGVAGLGGTALNLLGGASTTPSLAGG